MRLDDNYAKYQFARKATGGIGGWERNAVFPEPTMVLGKIEEGYKFVLGYPNQEFCTITSGGQLSLQCLTSATLSNYLAMSATSSTGAAIINMVNVRKAAPIFRASVVDKFETLVAEWKTTRNQLSSGTEVVMHPAYQKIIGMGLAVVPLILREMEANLDHWFWALKAITGKDPVPPAHRGRLKLMAKDWLDWAKKQGYQW